VKDELKTIYWMALLMGIFLPLAETIRRFKQLSDLEHIMYWFDDYILGGILIAAALSLKSEKTNAISYMIAAWGIATGALFLSFLGQFDYLLSNTPDPGGIFSIWFVFAAKGLILLFMTLGLMKSIKAAKVI
jgi:hypothetical protein